MDLAARAGMSGIQEWLSFYYKSPMVAEGLYPEHDLFIQLKKIEKYPALSKGGGTYYSFGARVLRIVDHTISGLLFIELQVN